MPELDSGDAPIMALMIPTTVPPTVLKNVVGRYAQIGSTRVDRYVVWPVDMEAARWIKKTLAQLGYLADDQERSEV